MQQQARLADDPALVSPEIDADQAEVLLLRQVEGTLLPAGAAVGGFHDQAGAAHQEAVTVVAKGHIQGVGAGGQGHRLPGAAVGSGQAGGDAAGEGEAENHGEHEAQQGGGQAARGEAVRGRHQRRE